MNPPLCNARVLVLGYGNPGRQDDGLGPAAAEAIQRLGIPGTTVEINYLLNIEDAADAALHDCVLFLDAAEIGPEPFELRELWPAEEVAFTSHIVKPEVILAICQKQFGRTPRAWLVAIRGYEFELQEGLTDAARANLDRAVAHLHSWLTDREEPHAVQHHGQQATDHRTGGPGPTIPRESEAGAGSGGVQRR